MWPTTDERQFYGSHGSKEESLLVVDPFGRKSNKYSSTHPQQRQTITISTDERL